MTTPTIANPIDLAEMVLFRSASSVMVSNRSSCVSGNAVGSAISTFFRFLFDVLSAIISPNWWALINLN